MVKTKKLLSAVLTAILICIASGMAVTASAECTEHTYDNGFCTNEGCGAYEPATVNSQNGIYEISNAGQLYWFAEYEKVLVLGSESAKLTADITVNSNVLVNGQLNTNQADSFKTWIPIGTENKSYGAEFDGQGHTISGLYFNDSETNHVGLFGYLGSYGTIKNVGIADSYFNGADYVGGICGYNDKKVTGCYSAALVSGTTDNVGGVCGFSWGTGVNNVVFNKSIYSGNAVGGSQSTSYPTDYAKTTAQFASGEVAYLLNGSTSEGDNLVWGQTLTGDNKDAYPVPHTADNTVYATTVCVTYTNTQPTTAEKSHSEFYASHNICPDCGLCEKATFTDNKYDINGDDEKDEVYEISNASQLYWFAGLVNGTLTDGTVQNRKANAVLTADFSVNSDLLKSLEYDEVDKNLITNGDDFIAWTPIGKNYSNSYTGIFDGQGYKISGLYFNDTTKSNVGLFGCIVTGKIKNVGVEDSYIKAADNIGGICGASYGGTITNCYNTGEIISSSSNVGGICGASNNGTITNCYNTGEIISSGSNVGGICGNGSGVTITNCYNTGEIIRSDDNVGGICGYAPMGELKNCYNIGDITGNNYVGGVCGYTVSGVTITKCYNTGKVTGAADVGGLIGNNSAKLTYCYSVNNVIGTGTSNIGGLCGCNYSNNINNSGLKTAKQFESGEVAYLLNESKSTGEDLVWGQTLTGDNADKSPVFRNASNTVYVTTKCVTYTNVSALSGTEKDHGKFSDDGFCPDCEFGYQPAELKNGVYEISNAGQLYWFAGLVNGTLTDGTAKNASANAVLTADITINKNVLNAETKQLNSGTFKAWTPMGDSTNNYRGTFNGQGHTISGLCYIGSDIQYVGLFGYLDSNGTIKNVGIIDTYFKSNYNNGSYVGGVCGYSVGIIESCYTAVTLERFIGPDCSAIAFVSGGTLRNNCNNSDFCNNIYYGGGQITNNSGKTTAEFASGAATWLLNGNSSEGVWKQTLTGDKPDTYPTFEGKTVYQQASGNTYANSLITTAKITADAPSFDENTTMYDKDGKTATDFVYDANADVTTVYVKIDGTEDGVKPIIKITGGNGTVESQTWTAVNNIYYAQFIGNFSDFGTIEVTYEGADSVTIPTTTSTEEDA